MNGIIFVSKKTHADVIAIQIIQRETVFEYVLMMIITVPYDVYHEECSTM